MGTCMLHISYWSKCGDTSVWTEEVHISRVAENQRLSGASGLNDCRWWDLANNQASFRNPKRASGYNESRKTGDGGSIFTYKLNLLISARNELQNIAAKEEKDLSFLLLCLPGLPGGTDSSELRLFSHGPLVHLILTRWRASDDGTVKCERGEEERGGGGLIQKFSLGIWSTLIYFLWERGLIASGSAATAGKRNKCCHTVALTVEMYVSAGLGAVHAVRRGSSSDWHSYTGQRGAALWRSPVLSF